MPDFHALVDAMPGREADVRHGLGALEDVRVAEVKEGSHDFLIRFPAEDFDKVDDFLQTYVRTIQGVMGVEVVVHWEDVSDRVRSARAQLG